MSNRLMRDGLRHLFAGMGDEAFFAAIDESGGWPNGYAFVGFCHTDDREAGFCNSSHNDGWWTVVASADDYYLWKLSPECMARIADAAIRAYVAATMHARPPIASVAVRNWRGHRAAVAKPPKSAA